MHCINVRSSIAKECRLRAILFIMVGVYAVGGCYDGFDFFFGDAGR
jgi:hypothetical protein